MGSGSPSGENRRIADRIADVFETYPLDAEAAAELARAVRELRSERTVDRLAEIIEACPADPEFGDHLARVVGELRGRPIG